jgi:exonuclease SbcD
MPPLYLDPALKFATLPPISEFPPNILQRNECHATPMKFIHTADILLDQSCAAMELPPALGNEHRAHLQAVLQKILNRARDGQADAVFITGDLFDHERVTRNTINFLREAFGALAPIPVFLCAGRRDPAVAGSPYLTEPWSDNVHCFTTPEWRSVEVPGTQLTVHGFGLTEPARAPSLPEGLEIPRDGRIHVALGHGLDHTVSHGEDGIAIFETPPTLPAGLAYLGLGGLQAAAAHLDEKGVPIHYPGSPESIHPGASQPHGYLEVQIASGSDSTSVLPIEISKGRFQSITLDCTPYTSGQELLDGIRAELLPRRDVPLIRLTLEGTLLRQIYDELDGIRDILGEEVHYLQWREDCEVGDDYDAIAGEHTSLGAFVQRISAEIADAPSHAVRLQRQRSRSLGVCAYRETPLPIKGLSGDYR